MVFWVQVFLLSSSALCWLKVQVSHFTYGQVMEAAVCPLPASPQTPSPPSIPKLFSSKKEVVQRIVYSGIQHRKASRCRLLRELSLPARANQRQQNVLNGNLVPAERRESSLLITHISSHIITIGLMKNRHHASSSSSWSSLATYRPTQRERRNKVSGRW